MQRVESLVVNFTHGAVTQTPKAYSSEEKRPSSEAQMFTQKTTDNERKKKSHSCEKIDCLSVDEVQKVPK